MLRWRLGENRLAAFRRNLLDPASGPSGRNFETRLSTRPAATVSQRSEGCKTIPSSVGPTSSYFHRRSERELMETSLGQLLGEVAERWPNRECLVSIPSKTRLTFSEVVRRADRLAAGLKILGLQRGDRIAVWGPNDVEWFLTSMAAARGGFVLVTLNPAYREDELLHCLRLTEPKVVVTSESFKTQNYPQMLLRAKPLCSNLEHLIVYSDNAITGTRRFSDVEVLASRSEVEEITAEQECGSAYDGCNIQFTSGTTGKPKAALLSHRSFVNNAREVAIRSGLGPEDKVCLNVPFFHVFGLVIGVTANLYAGSTIVLESRSFVPARSLEAIARERCTFSYGTPTMWINLINAREKLEPSWTGKLSSGIIGGSPASPELFRRMRSILGFEDAKTVYGLTETTAVVFQSMPNQSHELTETTVGSLSDHFEAMVVDEKGAAVPLGTPGELWIRGYGTMMGYWNDEENTRKTLTEDGWLKTGDRFILRADGYGQVIGRYKDMLIRGGENIFPKEIEDFLTTHPSVLEVQVIGAADEVYGEEICACVRLKDGAKLTADQLRDYCRGKISHFKIPRYVEFFDEFPKTVSGKVQKFLLREELERKGTIPSKRG